MQVAFVIVPTGQNIIIFWNIEVVIVSTVLEMTPTPPPYTGHFARVRHAATDPTKVTGGGREGAHRQGRRVPQGSEDPDPPHRKQNPPALTPPVPVVFVTVRADSHMCRSARTYTSRARIDDTSRAHRYTRRVHSKVITREFYVTCISGHGTLTPPIKTDERRDPCSDILGKCRPGAMHDPTNMHLTSRGHRDQPPWRAEGGAGEPASEPVTLELSSAT